MLPFEIKQVHIPGKLLPFEQKGPAALATVRTRLPALACSYFNTSNCGSYFNTYNYGARNRGFDSHYPRKWENARVVLPFEIKQVTYPQ